MHFRAWAWAAVSSLILGIILMVPASEAVAGRYGEQYCSDPDYHCIKVGRGQSWDSLFPDEREREIVMKLNRMNIRLRRGMEIAVPNDMAGKTYMDFSPFPDKIDPKDRDSRPARRRGDKDDSFVPDPELDPLGAHYGELESEPTIDRMGKLWDEGPDSPEGRKVLVFDPNLLAWAAYDGDGYLVRWGPAAGGKSYCSDVGRSCRTKTGVTRIYNKRGRWARSSKYPIGCSGRGCAAVPYYMGFFPSYGFHASNNVPGRHASHGCIRLFFEDAEWLHEEFVEVGTKAVIRRYK